MTGVTKPANTSPGYRGAAARPLRIAHVLDAPFELNDANGVAQVVRCLAQAQADIGESVAVFSGVDGPHVVGDGEQPRNDILTWRPDLLHFHSVHIPRHVALAARARRVRLPYCVTVHGALFPAALRRGRVKKALFNLLFERRFLREASFVHAVSPHEVEVIRRYGFEGLVVTVPNGVPREIDIAPGTEPVYPMVAALEAGRLFMFIGRLDPWQKGLDVLIEGFSHAAQPEALLVLVGPDSRGSRRSLEALAERLGIRSRVVFTGAAFGARRAGLVAEADVFVHTSRWEGLSLSVLSAAAAGKPCLLTRDADPLGSLERANAAVIVEPTASSIAEGIRRFAELGESELQVMGARAKQATKAHPAWPEIARRLGEAYRTMLVPNMSARRSHTRTMKACAP